MVTVCTPVYLINNRHDYGRPPPSVDMMLILLDSDVCRIRFEILKMMTMDQQTLLINLLAMLRETYWC